jgi:hypothetical protein
MATSRAKTVDRHHRHEHDDEPDLDRSAVADKSERADEPKSLTIPVPLVLPRVRTVHIPVLGGGLLVGAVRGVRSRLPSPAVALFYSGLATTAAIGAISWPVAVAIGVGTAVSRRAAGTHL